VSRDLFPCHCRDIVERQCGAAVGDIVGWFLQSIFQRMQIHHT
jgi:hypothetical protein